MYIQQITFGQAVDMLGIEQWVIHRQVETSSYSHFDSLLTQT
jgi:hypothetical protein